MEIIKKKLNLVEDDYYKKHLQLINPILPQHLTPKEIEVLAAFMALKGDIEANRFGTTARKFVMEKIGISYAGLSNYLASLKGKGFINGETILPILFPNPSSQQYYFKLNNVEYEEGLK